MALATVLDRATTQMLMDAGFDQSPDPMWVFDMRTLYFLAVNEASIYFYGYSREEFLSMTILDIRPTEDVVPLLREHVLNDRHNSEGAQWRHRKKNGDLVQVTITSRTTTFNRRPAEIVTVNPIPS